MGTWSHPFETIEKAEHFMDLLEKPLPVFKAEDALYDMMGDDELFDDIIDFGKEFGKKADVRDLVVNHLERWIKDMPRTHWEGLDKDAVKIIRQFVRDYRREHR